MPSVKVDAKKALASLAQIAKQIPFAAATAANEVAFKLQNAERLAMTQVFDHPRPFTAKSVLVDRATKSSMTATVYVRPEVAKYLLPYEVGGQHVLPGAGLLNPKDVGRDQYGQLSRGLPKRLSARPDVFVGTIDTKGSGPITGFWQRLDMTRKGTARRKRRERGTIYTAEHGTLKLLIRFGAALPVKKHLDFEKRAKTFVAANVQGAFARALKMAISTAK